MQLLTVLLLSVQLHFPGDTLTLSAVENIIGMPAKYLETVKETRPQVLRETTSYIALEKDSRSLQAVNLYYLKENYDNAALAHKTFADIITSNGGLNGQSVLTDLGDEAWMHSDKQNFSLLMVRKKNKLIRIKINKLPPTYSSKELVAASRQIIAAL